jgi:hypothetical protein
LISGSFFIWFSGINELNWKFGLIFLFWLAIGVLSLAITHHFQQSTLITLTLPYKGKESFSSDKNTETNNKSLVTDVSLVTSKD